MKKRTLLLLALAVIMVTSVSVPQAAAYFTTYTEAQGGYQVTIEPATVEERFYNWTKHVSVTNAEDGQPVYVRARAFAGSQFHLQYSGDGWSYNPDDGYYYYADPLGPGESANELLVHIDNIPLDPGDNDSFNVIVVYEYTHVKYDSEDNPYADWSSAEKGGNG